VSKADLRANDDNIKSSIADAILEIVSGIREELGCFFLNDSWLHENRTKDADIKNQRFSDGVDVNMALMNGEWTDVVTVGMRVEEALCEIAVDDRVVHVVQSFAVSDRWFSTPLQGVSEMCGQ
jgi:hypothetical protein